MLIPGKKLPRNELLEIALAKVAETVLNLTLLGQSESL